VLLLRKTVENPVITPAVNRRICCAKQHVVIKVGLGGRSAAGSCGTVLKIAPHVPGG
jgi:hypothetical protein